MVVAVGLGEKVCGTVTKILSSLAKTYIYILPYHKVIQNHIFNVSGFRLHLNDNNLKSITISKNKYMNVIIFLTFWFVLKFIYFMHIVKK